MIALFSRKTTLWDSVPPGVAVVIFFVLMCVVGMLEGMQIAFFAVAKRESNVFARKTCELLYSGDGQHADATYDAKYGACIGLQGTSSHCIHLHYHHHASFSLHCIIFSVI